MESKKSIINDLSDIQKKLGTIIDKFGIIDDDVNARIVITVTMFEIMDSIGKVETKVYNYLKGRG